MTLLSVNAERFQRIFPNEHRWKVADAALAIVRRFSGRMNFKFFGGMHLYKGQRVAHELAVPDLFAPNICVLDYAYTQFDRKTDVFLDYGCGLGTCGVYLGELGFRVLGYDIWKQLPRLAAEEFQRAVDGHVELIDSLAAVNEFKPTVALHVSIWCSDPIWEIPTLNWILSDWHYANSFDDFAGKCPPGFFRHAEYPGHLVVFKRR